MNEYILTYNEYIKFKKAWAIAVNSSKAKSYFTVCDEVRYDGKVGNGWKEPYTGCYYSKRKGTGRIRHKGWITAKHNLLYNILTNRPLHKGFSPVIEKHKNVYGSNMKFFYWTIEQLIAKINIINKIDTHYKIVKDLKANHTLDTMISLFTDCDYQKRKQIPNGLKTDHTITLLHNNINTFLEPFNGTVTIDILRRIDKSKLEMILLFERHKVNNFLRRNSF